LCGCLAKTNLDPKSEVSMRPWAHDMFFSWVILNMGAPLVQGAVLGITLLCIFQLSVVNIQKLNYWVFFLMLTYVSQKYYFMWIWIWSFMNKTQNNQLSNPLPYDKYTCRSSEEQNTYIVCCPWRQQIDLIEGIVPRWRHVTWCSNKLQWTAEITHCVCLLKN